MRKVALANDFLRHLTELGVVPATVRRVVIDAKMGEVVVLYVEYIGTPELLEVTPDDLHGAVIKVGDKEASPNG